MLTSVLPFSLFLAKPALLQSGASKGKSHRAGGRGEREAPLHMPLLSWLCGASGPVSQEVDEGCPCGREVERVRPSSQVPGDKHGMSHQLLVSVASLQAGIKQQKQQMSLSVSI